MADAIEAAGLQPNVSCMVCARRRHGNWPRPDAPRGQIMAITGHKSYSEIERYTKAAEQELSAEAAMGKWEKTENLHSASEHFTLAENKTPK